LSEFFAGVDITQPLPPTAISGPAGRALDTKTRR
jgi:hypothetical protein